jgi:hypothetical protein
VVRFDGVGERLVDHCGRPFVPRAEYLDDEGSVLLAGAPGVGLLDDRDLARYADRAQGLAVIPRASVPERFAFVLNPAA